MSHDPDGDKVLSIHVPAAGCIWRCTAPWRILLKLVDAGPVESTVLVEARRLEWRGYSLKWQEYFREVSDYDSTIRTTKEVSKRHSVWLENVRAMREDRAAA